MRTKRVFCAAITIAIMSLLTVAFAADPKTEAALTQMEKDWAQAMVKNDEATLNRVMADDWSLTTPDGTVQTRAEALADLKSGNMKFDATEVDDIKVRVFGDTAVVTGHSRDKSTYKGKDVSGEYRFTDVFVKRNGKWQAVATHVTAVKPM